MIISDMDNITGMASSPSRQTIVEELRKQTQALKDLRRQLQMKAYPTVSALAQSEARPKFVAYA